MTTQMFGEFLGTALLVLLGNGVVANALLKGTKGHGSGTLFINTGWFLAVFIAATITGRVSGAHLNPAVTLGLALKGAMPMGDVAGYMAAQLVGGIVGAILVWMFYYDHFQQTEDEGLILASFSTGPAIRNPITNFFSEAVGTCVLLLAIFGSGDAGISNIATYFVAATVWGIGISLGGTTGYAINPARDLGPRIAHAFLPIKNKGASDWSYSWVPVFGPLVGAALAVGIYSLLK